MIQGYRPNTVSIIRRTHIKRDSECNGNEKDSEKQLERKSQTIYFKKRFFFKIYNLKKKKLGGGGWGGGG